MIARLSTAFKPQSDQPEGAPASKGSKLKDSIRRCLEINKVVSLTNTGIGVRAIQAGEHLVFALKTAGLTKGVWAHRDLSFDSKHPGAFVQRL
jgi:hypothetical protein